MEKSDRQHWYRLVFIEGATVHALTLGVCKKEIRATEIIKAKEDLGASEDAIFISSSYLGYMTKSEYLGEE